ncbi:glycoside hydrolase family 3 protein [Modestobacter sp. I12A-02628]|uniref:beta-glucosidase n=1 Tax=Goekera deserti TaxID=2497753 RepID=A0A7K3WDJ7_9ACTN|nr:glycoside hydrolase family 3 N-terminal domain-containing protein [Goekera deserti]MPQ96780.1 glycoside hydrolase family 3 protein [Goekera deserti]NDI46906.1 glycoside hydrolase family 3 protein [Goekera deserti]NEL54474.1 glycoside hydrolase family 3 protein [Goekera deserti]
MTSTRRTAVSPDGTRFRDLDGDGVMAPYEDPRLSAEERTADLLPRLSRQEKAGLLFHTIIGVGRPGEHDEPAGVSPYTTRELVGERLVNHLNVHTLPTARETAQWVNAVQELAEQTPHGIPVTLSTDPRHGFTENSGVSLEAGSLSQWPESLGLAAIGDVQRVAEFADVVRREYLALGLRAALHPQVDLATEPRWGRQGQTFGQDAALSSAFVTAFLRGMQGEHLGPASVACTTKHFPGGGPQADGEDPHFPYGRAQVYPGGRFAEHLEPFRAAIAAGTSAVMPYYGMPVGLELDGEPVEEVAFGFNRQILTGLLREQLGYDGVVLTDWGLVTDIELFGKPFPAKAWGVEHLSPVDRVARVLDAGADQFGGEVRTDLVLELLADGRLDERRVDESVRRLLLVKVRLGLFDDPYVDEDAAEQVVGAAPFRAAGHRTQAESVTVLAGAAELPLAPGRRLYVEGVGPEVAAGYGVVVDDPADADLALVRLQAPFEPRDRYFLEAMFHQGSLDFPADVVERVTALAAQVPVVLDVTLDRPAVLTPFDGVVTVLTASYGCSDTALLDALSGAIAPRGRLPFELPRSMAAVRASRPDVPSDTADPLYPVGAGQTVAPAGRGREHVTAAPASSSGRAAPGS